MGYAVPCHAERRTALGGAEDAAEGAAEEDERGEAEVDARAYQRREEVHALFWYIVMLWCR